MSYLVNNICLLNSTYSKDKIQNIFKNILDDLGIKEFILISSIAPICSKSTEGCNSEVSIKCGNYPVIFKYNKNELTVPINDLKCLIASYIVAIENSIIYKDITDKISFGENADFPVFSTLIADITNEIEQYKRYGYDFCVAKISLENQSLGEKFEYKLKDNLKTIKDIVRATDSVYRDSKNIYILYRNIGIKDGVKLVDKLKKHIKDAEIGIAEWKSSYIIVDLLSEIDNFIYLSQTKQQSNNRHVREELNKVLNKAIMHGDCIIIVDSNELKDIHKKFKVLSFKLNTLKEYAVLKNYNHISDFNFLYEFNYEDIADDVFNFLIEHHK